MPSSALRPDGPAIRFLTAADSVTFVIAIAAVVVLPALAGPRAHKWLRRGPWQLPLMTASLAATWYGGIFGVTRIAFEQGIFSFVCQGIFWYGAYLAFAFLIVDRIYRLPGVTSFAEVVGALIGRRAARLTGMFNFFDILPVAYGVSLGLFLATILGGNPYGWSLAALVGIATYVVRGGLRTVIWTDFFQLGSMLVALLGVLVFSIWERGTPWELAARLPASHLDPTGGEPLSQLVVWGLIAASTLVDPMLHERSLLAGSPQRAKACLLTATGVWFLIDITTTLTGLYARDALPGANPEGAYLLYALQILPEGMRGIFCAGLVAAMVSTIDSCLLTSSRALHQGPVGRWFERPSVAIVVSALLAAAIGRYFAGNIKLIWKFFGSLTGACLLVPFLWSLWVRRVPDRAFLRIVGASTAALLFWEVLGTPAIDRFYVGAGVSLLLLAGEAAWHQLTDSRCEGSGIRSPSGR